MQKNLNHIHLFIFIILSLAWTKAQDTYYPIEVGANLGISVPTVDSNPYRQSPEKVIGSLNVSYFKTMNRGYISGLKYGHIAQFDEICIPLYYTYRSKSFHAPFDPYQTVLSNSLNYLIPQQVQFYGGVSNGYIFGENNKNLELNRKYMASLDLGLKGGYMLGPFRAFIGFEFDLLLTNNYSFRTWTGRTSPNLFFSATAGISWSY